MIVFDVEIEKAILGRGEAPIEGISYCNGWRDFEGMGISCVCTYDITTHLSRAFLQEDKDAFMAYVYRMPTAGFNTRRFDIPLLNHHGWWPGGNDEAHYDMLEEIWVALGLNPDKFSPKTHGGWGLDAVCEATLGIRKTGHGAAAPVWWQQGKKGRVIDYCLNDIWMEGSLLLHILREGTIGCPEPKIHEHGPALQLPRPSFVGSESLRSGLLSGTALQQLRDSALMSQKPSMDASNIVGGQNEPQLAEERAKARAAFEKRAADALNGPSPSGSGLGIVR